AIAIGDTATAGNVLSVLLQQYPSAPESRPAALALASVYSEDGNWSSAAALLAPLAGGDPEDPLTAPAIFWLARAHEAAGAHEAAIAAYEAYLDLETPLAPYGRLRQAAQYIALGRTDAAIAGYAAVGAIPIAPIMRANALERAAALEQESGRPSAALEHLEAILAFAQDPDYRARLLSEAAALAEQSGDPLRAREFRRRIIDEHPTAPQAAATVDQLIAAGEPELSSAAVGRIFFNAERWADAATWLASAAAAAGDPAQGAELGRLWGLAVRAQGDYAGALAILAEAGARSPDSPEGRLAQLSWVQTIGQSGDRERAWQGYREFAAAYPADPLAPEALDRAAQLLDMLGDPAGAATQRLELGRAYPQSEQGQLALHQVGLARFSAADYAGAADAYAVLADNATGVAQARGAFWAAQSAQAVNDQSAAQTRLEQALSAAPTSYYGVRAAEELDRIVEGSRPLDQPLSPDEWTSLDAWAAALSGADPAAAPQSPAAPFVERARLLRAVGLDSEADGEWRAGLEAADTPRAMVAFARAAVDATEFSYSLRAAESLIDASDGNPPIALNVLRFPTPYPGLVRNEAAANNLDPRLFYALLRQESLFDPNATSWVGARGLAQVMPETGQGIAQNLGVSDFSLNDLYRPAVSIRFGSFYLGQRIQDMNGSVHGALAAYNGGLGNSMRWAGGSTVADPDLFVELIDFPETKGYVQAVYRFYAEYRRLYGR
ncbi:MAG: transglycosylase SLT domain-containing protein, partial [Oscillochloris sp.]|nr:transglycosylase SLT domain-containing protein [Oscillochloris sp.]